jgi:hypothetical protein
MSDEMFELLFPEEAKQRKLRLARSREFFEKHCSPMPCRFCKAPKDWQEQINDLREKLNFLRSTCPEERADDGPGFTQAEAYFWKRKAEGK